MAEGKGMKKKIRLSAIAALMFACVRRAEALQKFLQESLSDHFL